jgi:hypothetical protein
VVLTTLSSGFYSCTLATSNGVATSFAKSTKTTTTTIYEVQGSPCYLFALGPFALIIIYIIICRILKINEV